MAYLFTTPHVLEGYEGTHRLFSFYQFRKGVTVCRFGSDFIEVRNPSQDYLDSADNYWLGGHVYEVSDDMAALLGAAGYNDNLESI